MSVALKVRSARGFGEVAFLQEWIPDGFAIVPAILTQVGDVWFLGTLLCLLYWFGRPDRTDVATLAGTWLAGIGVYNALKEVFALPRPSAALVEHGVLAWPIRPVYEATGFATGYGFPSGHAVNTTIVLLGLAMILPVSSSRRRHLGAFGLIGIVGATRVVLGLHYLVDVIAGVCLGGILVLGCRYLIDGAVPDRASIGFGMAIVGGVLYAVTSQLSPDAVILLGGAIGGFAGLQFLALVGDDDTFNAGVRSRRVRASLLVGAVVLIGIVFVASPSVSIAFTGGLAGIAGVVLVSAPSLGEARPA